MELRINRVRINRSRPVYLLVTRLRHLNKNYFCVLRFGVMLPQFDFKAMRKTCECPESNTMTDKKYRRLLHKNGMRKNILVVTRDVSVVTGP